jgi:hypothetical protein
VSVLLHAALLAMLFHGLDAPPETPKERSVSVDIISAAQYAAAVAATHLTAPTARTEVVQPAPVPVEPPPVAPAPTPPPAEVAEPSGMVHATELKAAGVLAEPGSKEVRETLPLLASDERMTQLCDIEALEQIHLWKDALHPDTLVAYAMAETQVTAHTIQADGGAFRDARQWYQIKFRCEVADDFQSVTDFQFAVGDLIPESEWDAHNLTAEEIE